MTSLPLAVLFATVLLAQSRRPTPAPEKASPNKESQAQDSNAKAGTNKNPPKQTPSAFNPAVPTQVQEASKDASQKSPDPSSTDWWVAAFTGALVLVSGLQFWAMHRQAEYMRHSLEETRKATDAATRSSEAAKLSAEVAEKSVAALKDSERVWLLADIRGAPDGYRPNGSKRIDHWELKPLIHNYGKSVAILTSVRVHLECVPKEYLLPPEPDYENCIAILPTRFPIAPEPRWAYQPCRLKMTEDHFFSVLLGEKSVWVYGCLDYLDSFGGAHTTRFCFFFRIGDRRDGFYPEGPASYIRYT
jgi:hypothetical protein